ncbi:MAG: PHP domain-containing protein [Spirochaetes bacterium]|nr:PHP domain-containing protein [Spirochaetota bacterium]
MKGCIHIHTNCSDGDLSPQQVADEYSRRGYDFIAFTDHDYLLKPNYREEYARVKTDMIVFHGVELTVFAKGYMHINRIEGVSEVLHVFNHLSEYGLSAAQVCERVEFLSGMYPIDAVEITSKGFRVREFEEINISLPKIASDDAHGLVGIGRAWIELDARRNKDSIIKAIKAGDFWNCFL